MTEQREDFLANEFVFNIIQKEEWVTEEILLIYEHCYRRLKKLAKEFGLDTMEMDRARNKVMETYNQL
jgi:hypothetical protein